MTQRAPDGLVVPVAVVRVGAQPQLNHLSSVPVQAERAGLVACVLDGIHLGEQADGEAVAEHCGADARVGSEPLEVGGRAGGVGEEG